MIDRHQARAISIQFLMYSVMDCKKYVTERRDQQLTNNSLRHAIGSWSDDPTGSKRLRIKASELTPHCLWKRCALLHLPHVRVPTFNRSMQSHATAPEKEKKLKISRYIIIWAPVTFMIRDGARSIYKMGPVANRLPLDESRPRFWSSRCSWQRAQKRHQKWTQKSSHWSPCNEYWARSLVR